jgi:hypothetical protein
LELNHCDASALLATVEEDVNISYSATLAEKDIELPLIGDQWHARDDDTLFRLVDLFCEATEGRYLGILQTLNWCARSARRDNFHNVILILIAGDKPLLPAPTSELPLDIASALCEEAVQIKEANLCEVYRSHAHPSVPHQDREGA